MMLTSMDDYLSLLLKQILYQGGIYCSSTILQQNQTNKKTPTFLLSCYLSPESVKIGLVFPK